MISHYLSFMFIRLFTLPALLMPYSWVHAMGRGLGIAAYYLLPKFRKRTLSNLSIALSLDEKQLVKIAKESMQNLMITCLEYSKLAWEKKIHRIAFCENPLQAQEILKNGQSVIFFCGHQANWEVLFLEGTSRMPGVAIGRPIKNKVLYEWVLAMRQKYGGKIITPQNAIREGLRALKKGCFLGIVGDQGMPDSGYSSDFFGRRAWTSPIPAILSYRTGCPIIVATTLREKGKYRIHYSDPIWPNENETMEKEIDRMMQSSLLLLEESIKKAPGQWLWQHNRWKQQTTKRVKRAFRQETILIVLPEEKEEFAAIESHLPTFRDIYPLESITLMIPKSFAEKELLSDVERIIYDTTEELFIKDFRFKLIFNFTDEIALKKHFTSLSAVEVVSLSDLAPENLSESLKKVLCHAL